MKLERVKIKNFRSIKEATIEFDPSCRVLVGKNESGKSNILKALRLLDRGYAPSNDDKRTIRRGEKALKQDGSDSYVAFIFTLHEEEAQKLFEVTQSKVSLLDRLQPYIGRLNGKVVTIDDMLSAYLSKIEYRVNLQTGERHYLNPIIQSENFKPTEPTTDLYRILSESSEEVLSEHLPSVLFWRYKDKDILPEKVNLQSFRGDPDSYPLLKNMFLLYGVEDDKIGMFIDNAMGSGITDLENHLAGIAETATDHLKAVWEERRNENIQFSLKPYGESEITMNIKEERWYKFEQRSDGFKRFIYFLLTLSFQAKTNRLRNTLLLLDEPSTGLHPSSERDLLDELIKISNKNYLVYSTHSIFMIDLKKIKRHYIVKRDDEITNVRETEKSRILDEEVLYKSLGFSFLDILKLKNIIFEGWRDKRIFELVIEKMDGEIKSIGYCHADGAHDIKLVSAMLELAGRQCLIVSDCDTDGRRAQKEYTKNKGYGDWKTYKDIDRGIDAITGEDFINNDHIVKRIGQIIPSISPKLTAENLPQENKLKTILKLLKENNLEFEKKDIQAAIFEKLEYKNIDMNKYQKLLDGITKLVSN